jgi:hypothetical protein
MVAPAASATCTASDATSGNARTGTLRARLVMTILRDREFVDGRTGGPVSARGQN